MHIEPLDLAGSFVLTPTRFGDSRGFFSETFRASTMIDARDLGHSIFNVDAHGPATTLWNFWMDN